MKTHILHALTACSLVLCTQEWKLNRQSNQNGASSSNRGKATLWQKREGAEIITKEGAMEKEQAEGPSTSSAASVIHALVVCTQAHPKYKESYKFPSYAFGWGRTKRCVSHSYIRKTI